MVVLVVSGCFATSGRTNLRTGSEVDLLSSLAPDSMRVRVLHEMEKIEGYQVTRDDGDVLETTWREIPGKTTGFWWWKRKWLARVCFQVALVPKANGDRLASGVRITGQYEERPNANFPWKPGTIQQLDDELDHFKPLLISRLRDSDKATAP